MDKGQPVQPNLSGQPVGDFFTSGVGTNEDSANNFRPEDNLDLTSSGAAIWGQTPERDHRKTGREVIVSSVETEIASPEIPNEAFNQIISPEMPPGYPKIEETPNNNKKTASIEDIIDFSNFKESKNKVISKEALEATIEAVQKFTKGQISPAKLDEIRSDAAKAYVKNSFGRE